jgi:hypothetical protein
MRLAPAVFWLGLASCAHSDANGREGSGDQKCFSSRSVTSFATPNEESVYVRVGASSVYRVDLFGPCLNLEYARSLEFRTRGGGSWICGGNDADLMVPDVAMTVQPCRVTAVHPLSDDELAALPANARP